MADLPNSCYVNQLDAPCSTYRELANRAQELRAATTELIAWIVQNQDFKVAIGEVGLDEEATKMVERAQDAANRVLLF